MKATNLIDYLILRGKRVEPAALFNAEKVWVWELEDGSIAVEIQFYPWQPLAERNNLLVYISAEAIRQYGLVENLLALAAHIRSVQRELEEKEKRLWELL
jgi:hypothetical protein